MRRKIRNKTKRIRKIVISRGGIQLCAVGLLVGSLVLAISCTIRHKILPTTIDVNSMEYITDSIDSLELWENLQ
jgi:hypothetical protein